MRVAGKWDHQTKEDEMLQAQLEWDEIKKRKDAETLKRRDVKDAK